MLKTRTCRNAPDSKDSIKFSGDEIVYGGEFTENCFEGLNPIINWPMRELFCVYDIWVRDIAEKLEHMDLYKLQKQCWETKGRLSSFLSSIEWPNTNVRKYRSTEEHV